MIDHLGVQVADVDAALAWYLQAFGPIGLRKAMRFPVEGGFVVGLAGREWPEYHPGYYGVFLRDLDGHNVEAVCHGG